MNRKELLVRLDSASSAMLRRRGDGQLLTLIRWYVAEKLKDEYEFSNILSRLPADLAEAVRLFALNEGLPEEVSKARAEYLAEMGDQDIPLLTQVGFSGAKRVLLVIGIAMLMAKVTGFDFLEESIKAYCFAEDTLLSQRFDKFLVEVGKSGLFAIYDAAPSNCSGTFGQIDLRIGGCAGRLMATFAWRREGKTTYSSGTGPSLLELPYVEESITFICDESRKDQFVWGIQSCRASFDTAWSMINEVIDNWPDDPEEQKKIFQLDEEIGIGF